MKVVVVGLGVMGLPTVRALAERGHEVIGIDRHGISAPAGSSAGMTRIFRLAHDRPGDIVLARKSLERWRELEAGSGEQLLDHVGLVLRGDPSPTWAAALRDAGIPVEELDASGVERVFPELSHRPQEPAAFVPDDGVLFAAKGLAAMAAAARAAGAELSAPERMLEVEETPAGVRVTTNLRVLEADIVVLAVGPWAQTLLEPLGIRLPLAPGIGQVSYWRGGGAWERRPSLIDFVAPDKMGVYGLPTPGKGYNIGLDYGCEETWDPDATSWPHRGFEEECNRDWVISHAPGLASDGPHLTESCPWTLTPDNEYFIDRRGPITVATGCSGHAFKFMPIMGELIGDIAEGRPAWPEADIYGIDRLAPDTPFDRVETPMGPRVGI